LTVTLGGGDGNALPSAGTPLQHRSRRALQLCRDADAALILRQHMRAETGARPRDPSQPGLKDSRDPIQINPRRRLDFAAINAAALCELPTLLARWLPAGRVNGREYEARNPRRGDRHAGSFRVNLRTGRWADFATTDKGGDPVSLTAYLFDLSQTEAARRLADMLGVC
jgi:hypothetical protein